HVATVTNTESPLTVCRQISQFWGFRFRYECEGPSHGGLPGASSEKNRRTYPTVKINNYVGHARVEVQLVTHTDPPRVHAHSLVGRHCTEKGICTVDVGPNDLTASFSNLGILHVTKKGVGEILNRRLRDEKLRQTFRQSLTDAEEQACSKEAKELGKVMDLNIVRLQFTAYLQDSNGGFTRALKPVVSNPIYDSKSPNASNLKISRMDKTCGSVLGGDEIFLLCDKVQKDDIEIRFYEEDDEGGWEAFGDFSPTDVHKQYAIVFKTPPYHSAEIERPVTVFLQLKRKKAGDCSDPKQFTYIPQVPDKEEVLRKKQKPLPHYEHWRGGGGGRSGGAGGFGGAAGGGGGEELALKASRAARSGDFPTQNARQTASALLQYCSTGDVRVLLAIQRHLCGVQDSNGDTPLHLAIIHQQTDVMQQLIHTLLSSQQQNILNTANHLRQTPLHLAVITRQVKAVEMLLSAGADPSLLDKDGRTPLHLAALAGDNSMLRYLLAHLNECHGHLINSPDYHGLNPLHLAVRRDGERTLRLLVEGGANVDAAEQKSGNTALHLAVRESLFKLKADVNAVTFGGNTPLHLAASLGSPSLCSMLIAAGQTETFQGQNELNETCLTGADKNVENDEPLFSSSSSDEEQDGDEPTRDEVRETVATGSQPLNPRKRRAGHTPLDLAKSGDDDADSPVPGQSGALPTPAAALQGNILQSNPGILNMGVSRCTLPVTYLMTRSVCVSVQLGGGPVEGLVEALQSLGLTEGVRLLRNAELRADKHSTDATVDSGFGSQPMEDEQPPVANE
uniref:RHD domain-containing protein n=1 Tax=Anabas testudineus TaxID=64144 RepID=A0A7N6C0Y1_ANATE